MWYAMWFIGDPILYVDICSGFTVIDHSRLILSHDDIARKSIKVAYFIATQWFTYDNETMNYLTFQKTAEEKARQEDELKKQQAEKGTKFSIILI